MQRVTNTNYSAQVIHGAYYPHIDGIRALAVLPVVFYHILAALCPGGFIGVDVFFVISGYLITRGILRDLEHGRFSIRNFYYRRIRRIMPAYFTLITGVFAAGCMFYYASPLIFLGDAVASGTLFLANFHFWMIASDYFSPQLHSEALLHLWSLSVEEQFYLVIPLLCAGIWKVSRRLIAPIFTLLAILSLTGAIWAIMADKQSIAFYFPHLRAWELLAGSLLAMVPLVMVPAIKSRKNESLKASPTVTANQSSASFSTSRKHTLLAAVGLLLVLTSYLTVSSTTPFPGLAALPAVIGTVMLIRYGYSGWVSRLLSCRPFVFIGKISYSLYLWHWPVIVFWKYVVYDQLYAYDYIGMFSLSLLLGYLSWRFVELPVRTSSAWTMRRSFTFAGWGIALLVVLGSACVYYQGWPTRINPEANQFKQVPPRTPFFEARARGLIRRAGSFLGQDWCSTRLPVRYHELAFASGEDATRHIGNLGEAPEIMLVGDSHAGSLQYGLDISLRDLGIGGRVVGRSATQMFNLNNSECQRALDQIQAFPTIKKVILTQYWFLYLVQSDSSEKASFYQQLEEFARHIKALDKTLYILTDNPSLNVSSSDIAAKMQIVEPRWVEPHWDGRQSQEEYLGMQGEINARIKEICHETGAVFVPLHLSLLEDGFFPAFMEKNGAVFSLYRDSHHLSLHGSLRSARALLPCIFPEIAGAAELEE